MSDDRDFLGMEQKSVQVNHEEAMELAHIKKNESNLARCYLAMMAERDQWKANHDNQVALKAAIMQRPDLKERADLVIGLVHANNTLLLQLRNRDSVINAAEKTLREMETAYMELSDGYKKLEATGNKAVTALCNAGFTLKDEKSEWSNWTMTKIQAALGNGLDEDAWPPGTDWLDAACKQIRCSRALGDWNTWDDPAFWRKQPPEKLP